MNVTVFIAITAILAVILAALFFKYLKGEGHRNATLAAFSYGAALIGVSNLISHRTTVSTFLMVGLGLIGGAYFTSRVLKSKPLPRGWFVVPAIVLLFDIAIAGVQIFGGPAQPAAAAASANTDFNEIPGQLPKQSPGIPGAAIAPVGACVSLEGPSGNATLKATDCGSPTNGYKVIQRVSTPDQCPADVDHKFYMNPEEGQFTACLDYAWSANDCLSIGKVTAVRAACDDTSKPKREKPLKVILNATTNAGCGPTGGFPHAVRKFTVCTETQP